MSLASLEDRYDRRVAYKNVIPTVYINSTPRDYEHKCPWNDSAGTPPSKSIELSSRQLQRIVLRSPTLSCGACACTCVAKLHRRATL